MDLDALAQSLPTKEMSEGDVLLEQGTMSGKAYVLVEGLFEVSRDGLPLCVLDEKGAPIGEMAALLNTEHTATVTAQSAAKLLVIEDYAQFAKEHPEVMLHLARALAERLANTNRYVVHMQKQFDEILSAPEAPSPEKISKVRDLWDKFGEFMRTEIAPF